MNKKLALTAVLICVCATLTVLAQDQRTPVSIVRVAVAPVYDEIPLTGTVIARRISHISPKIGGFVAELLVDDGDTVKQGDPLLHLDPVMARIGLARAKAQVQESRAILNKEGLNINDYPVRINALLRDAENDIEALRLTSPEGNNAVDKYRQVLNREPENLAAQNGMSKVAGKYLELVENSLQKGDLQQT